MKRFLALRDELKLNPQIFDEIVKNNYTTIENALRWVWGEESTFNLDKGFIITGHVGSGKTMFMRLLQNYAASSDKNFDMINFEKLRHLFNVEGYKSLDYYTYSLNDNTPQSWCFDDLGVVNSDCFSFGNKINLTSTLIYERHEIFISNKKFTHFTTNIPFTEFRSKYDSRIVSRLNEMCQLIVWKGRDYRG